MWPLWPSTKPSIKNKKNLGHTGNSFRVLKNQCPIVKPMSKVIIQFCLKFDGDYFFQECCFHYCECKFICFKIFCFTFFFLNEKRNLIKCESCKNNFNNFPYSKKWNLFKGGIESIKEKTHQMFKGLQFWCGFLRATSKQPLKPYLPNTDFLLDHLILHLKLLLLFRAWWCGDCLSSVSGSAPAIYFTIKI